MPASKPWGCPENMKGTMGKHQKFRALQPYIPYGQGGPLKPSALHIENFSIRPECLESHAIMAHIVFMRSHFRTQGKFTTDCDGLVRHEKWQEPAGTLSVALTAYNFVLHTCHATVPWHGESTTSTLSHSYRHLPQRVGACVLLGRHETD